MIVAAIVRADEDIAKLARDVDPHEEVRIKESLARTAEPKMRELLERQGGDPGGTSGEHAAILPAAWVATTNRLPGS